MFGLYERAMLRELQATVERSADMTAEARAAVATARRIAEFDDAFTARRNGWRDSAEYYAVNSAAQCLPRITVPMLVIYAVDDPVVPSAPDRAVDWAALEQAGLCGGP